jgi:dienelactone hydrolase
MDESEVGVVLIPMLFGASRSFRARADQLRGFGYRVEAVDIWESRPPFFLPFVAGPRATTTRRNSLADKVNDEALDARIQDAAARLKSAGCKRVIMVGFGYGGIAALRNASDGAAAWYPHLVFPPGSTKSRPPLGALDCPVMLFYGMLDTETPESIIQAESVCISRTNVALVLYPDAGHAFLDRFVQGSWPSVMYRRHAAGESWALFRGWLRQVASA